MQRLRPFISSAWGQRLAFRTPAQHFRPWISRESPATSPIFRRDHPRLPFGLSSRGNTGNSDKPPHSQPSSWSEWRLPPTSGRSGRLATHGKKEPRRRSGPTISSAAFQKRQQHSYQITREQIEARESFEEVADESFGLTLSEVRAAVSYRLDVAHNEQREAGWVVRRCRHNGAWPSAGETESQLAG